MASKKPSKSAQLDLPLSELKHSEKPIPSAKRGDVLVSSFVSRRSEMLKEEEKGLTKKILERIKHLG